MGNRSFGLGNRYSIVRTVGGQRQPAPEQVARRLFGPAGSGDDVLLGNGGRLRFDVISQPGYVTPECGSVLDLVVHDKAGPRVTSTSSRRKPSRRPLAATGRRADRFRCDLCSCAFSGPRARAE
jgi:hypothetical protein